MVWGLGFRASFRDFGVLGCFRVALVGTQPTPVFEGKSSFFQPVEAHL